MIDTTTHTPVLVSAYRDAGAYIMAPRDQIESITSVLRQNQISHWVDSNAISVNGQPEVAFVVLGGDVNAAQVQLLLDAVK